MIEYAFFRFCADKEAENATSVLIRGERLVENRLMALNGEKKKGTKVISVP